MEINLSKVELLVLQGLRAGGMDTVQMLERYTWNYRYAISKLKNKGFVVLVSPDYYELTEHGRKHCPKRSEVALVIPHQKRKRVSQRSSRDRLLSVSA